MESGALERVVFSSDALSPQLDDRARFSLWRDFMLRVYGELHISRVTDRPFSQYMEARQINGAGLVHFRGTTDRLTRTSRTVAATRSQDFFFTLNRGRTLMSMSQLGRETVLEPRTAALGYGAESGDLGAKGENAYSIVIVPHARLRELVTDAEDLVARPLPNGTAAMRHLQRYLDFLSAPDGIEDEPALAIHIETTLIDLVALALGARRDAAEIASRRGLRAARRFTIKAEIERHIEEPDLSVSAVAARHGISPRYIQALFEDEGTTFSAYRLSRRLARVRGLLASPKHGHRRIADIAYSVGFGDLSHFNRAFRRQYGATPSDVRAQALAEPYGWTVPQAPRR